MSLRIDRLITAAAATCAALLVGGAAHAFPDSRVEAQTRPDFGLLLKPHLRHHHHHQWGGSGGYVSGGCYEHCGAGYRDGGFPPPGYGPGYGPRGPIGPMLDAASIDCNDPAQGGHLRELVARMNPGGTLLIKPGSACVGAIYIDKPMTIQGQGDRPHGRDVNIGPDHSDEIEAGVARILAPPEGGMPCIVVRVQDDVASDSQRAVILRNIALESGTNNDESCLDIEQGVVRLEGVMVDYQGHGAAVFVGNGALITGDKRGEEEGTYDQGRRETAYIQAPHAEEGVDVQGGMVEMRDTTVRGGQIGINFESADKGSTIDGLAIVLPHSEEAGRAFETGSAGISVSGRGVGALTIRDSFICGYGVGVFIESANVVHVNNNSICQAGKGIYAAGGQFSATDNFIAATNIGIQIGAASGIDVHNNSIYGTANEERGRGGDYFIYVEPGGSSGGIRDNTFYSGHGICAWLPVDDGYFHGRRRPWHNRWHDWYYMPAHHSHGFGVCKDPQEFVIDEEARWFPNEATPEHYGVQAWPTPDQRVGDPFDGYEWDRPWDHDGHGAPHSEHH